MLTYADVFILGKEVGMPKDKPVGAFAEEWGKALVAAEGESADVCQRMLTYADECLRMQIWKEAHAQFRDLVKNHQPMEI